MNIRTATIRTPRRRIYSPATMRRKPATSTFRISKLEIAGMFAAFVLFCIGVWTSYEVKQISADITRLHSEQMALSEDGARLEQEKARLTGAEYLAPLGRKLGLHPAKPGQTVTLN